MKFHQLPVGSRFELDGRIYVKVTPLIAQHEADGRQQLVRRSASVRLAQGAAALRAQPRPLPPAEVRERLDAFYARCLQCIDELAADAQPGRGAEVRRRLAEARDELVAGLGLETTQSPHSRQR
ncbi:MAG: hypothetical protein P8076_05060 [Gammaproteobacteria bacterium]